jgi:hypothetical protein
LTIERVSPKNISFEQFVNDVFGREFVGTLNFKLHTIPLRDLSVEMGNLENYAHPDGFLYIHF